MYCSKCGRKMELKIRCFCENIEDNKWYNCKVGLDKDGVLLHFPIGIKDDDFDIIDWEYKAKCKKCGNTQEIYEDQVIEHLKTEDNK